MQFQLKIRRVGNSAGVTLSREVLQALRVEEGDELFLVEGPNGFELRAYDDELASALTALGESYREYREVYRELAK